jgi:GTP pyrophosphokinase
MDSTGVASTLQAGVDQQGAPHWIAAFAPAEQRGIERALALWSQHEPIAHARQAALDTADILADLQFDAETLSAALLAALPAAYRPEDAKLRETFGASVAALVQGALRVSQIEPGAAEQRADSTHVRRHASHGRLSIENLRKLLLAIAQDVRVVVIALAQRTALMRASLSRPEAERRLLGQQTLDLFAPLANRLGMWQLKWELEDLAFRCLEPELYRTLARELDEKRAEREAYIAGVIAALRHELDAAGLSAEVSGRPKHIYSIHQKMQRKGVGLSDVYDVRAVRIMLPAVTDCYTALGVVHNLWQPIPQEFDDYISQPKGNRYRSLHTAVNGPDGKPLEVQIRTHEMHRAAELGIAAHWRYKEGGKTNSKVDEQIAWLREVLNFQSDLVRKAGLSGQAGAALFDDTVFVLTPQGKVLDLPKGATPVDFAYELHTELGHRCRGAKVDGHIVPLNYRLQNAQHVEIISVKQGGPSRDWLVPALGYLHTHRALAKVRQWFKQQEHDEQVTHGRALLDKELQRAGATGVNLETLAARLQFAKAEEVFIALARGELSSRQIQTALAPNAPTRSSPEAPSKAAMDALPVVTTETKPAGGSSAILVLGVNNIATQIAKCCKPLPPEAIIGFVTRGRGVIVHRVACANVKALKADQTERLMPAQWSMLAQGGKLTQSRFPVEVVVEATDRQGLLRDVSDVFTRDKVNVLGARTATRAEHARMHFNIEVSDALQLQHVCALLREVNGVQFVGRKL